MKNKLKLILPSVFILFLASCKNVVKDGQVMEEYVIKLGDTWTLSQGVFDAIIIWPLSQLLNYISEFTGPVIAIIVITTLVKLVTLPMTLQSQIMTQRMQEINPKLQAIQEKYRGRTDEQAKMLQAQEMTNLYRKYDIKISKMFVPTFLQFPILIALWQAIQRSYAVISGTLFGYSLMTTPLEGFKQGNFFYITIFIILFVTQTISMLLPQWLAKRKAKLYPGQKPPQQNKMMYFMVVLFAWFGLMWNTGMAIYFIVSSLIQIAQTFYSQKIIDGKKGM